VTHSGPEVLFQDLRRDEIRGWWWWWWWWWCPKNLNLLFLITKNHNNSMSSAFFFRIFHVKPHICMIILTSALS